jgi:hypothetical protein
MALRPTSARTHSGTPSLPIFNDRGYLADEWISPQGWSCSPAKWSDDPDLNDGCDWCGHAVDVICLPPSTVKKDPKTMCRDCFALLAEASVKAAQ